MKKSKKLILNNLKKRAFKSPFGLRPKGISFAISSQLSGNTFCDYGCRDGTFLFEILKLKNYKNLLGIDLDGDSLEKAKFRDSDNLINWIKVEKSKSLPLKSNSVDLLTMTDVLEHIYDKKFILNEIHRILSPNGMAIFTVPGKHFFSFLDMGNFKFRFPALHKFWYVFFKGIENYNYRYVNNPYGLIGDIEKEASWHQHFSFDSFSKLASSTKLKIIKSGGMGFFYQILLNMRHFTPKPFKIILNKLMDLDRFLFSKTEIFFICIKK